MRRWRSHAVFVLLVALAATALLPAPAIAGHRQRQKELQRLIEEKREALARAEAEERDIMSEIRASDRRRDALQHEINVLTGRLNDARSKIAVLESRLNRLHQLVLQKTRELEATIALLQEYSDRLDHRIAEIYMAAPGGAPRAPGLLTDINDVILATEYESALVETDERLVQSVDRTRRHIEGQRATIERTKLAVQADRDEIASQAKRIAEARGQLNGRQQLLVAELRRKNRLLAEVRREQEEYLAAIRSYTVESDSIALFLRGVQAGQTVIQGRGGWLRWPVSGRITSPFGPRTHPVYGYKSFHTGIDISSPTGALVKAARAGKVVFTGYKGAFGNVVLIDHGSGVATMYAHLSKIYARDGQTVRTLGGIAAVGSTGWSTGPHLHFEVRVNGNPVNPLSWL